jgi:hypothetical protein
MSPPGTVSSRRSTFAALRRLTEPPSVQEHCELCNLVIPPGHRHLLEVSQRRVVCSCDGCALRFQLVIGGRFKLIPRDAHALPGFQLTDAQWESLALPINLAFLFHHTPANKMMALYPSPAGATESLLPLEAWNSLLSENPVLAQMEPDVQALLVNRVGDCRQYYLAPIDTCYALVGLIRMHWQGLAGGEKVWTEIASFFTGLEAQSVPLPEMRQEAHHA